MQEKTDFVICPTSLSRFKEDIAKAITPKGGQPPIFIFCDGGAVAPFDTFSSALAQMEGIKNGALVYGTVHLIGRKNDPNIQYELLRVRTEELAEKLGTDIHMMWFFMDTGKVLLYQEMTHVGATFINNWKDNEIEYEKDMRKPPLAYHMKTATI